MELQLWTFLKVLWGIILSALGIVMPFLDSIDGLDFTTEIEWRLSIEEFLGRLIVVPLLP